MPRKPMVCQAAGINLVGIEKLEGLEDLFGIKNTGVMKNITQITHTGDFCAGMSENCDDPRCKGSYLADDAEILLNAKIPVLTVKHKTAELSGVPQANREIVLLQENENERVFRALLQKGELPIMMFQPK